METLNLALVNPQVETTVSNFNIWKTPNSADAIKALAKLRRIVSKACEAFNAVSPELHENNSAHEFQAPTELVWHHRQHDGAGASV